MIQQNPPAPGTKRGAFLAWLLLLLPLCAANASCVLNLIAKNLPAQRSQYLDYSDSPGIEVGSPTADKALVLFIRPEDVRVREIVVLDGEHLVTHLTEKTGFVYEASPGNHAFMAFMTGGPSFVDATLQADRVYAIAVLAHADGRPVLRLEPVTPGTELWGNLPGGMSVSREVKPNDQAAIWFAEHRGELLAKRSARSDSWRVRTLAGADGSEGLPRKTVADWDAYKMWIIK